MLRICLASARVREDLADIINTAIEELVRQRYELPGFSTLFRAARAARFAINRGYYRQIYQATDALARANIATLFERDSAERRSSWDRLKSEPDQPTVKRIRAFLVHLDWLRKQAASTNPLTGIPAVKLQRFAAEARVLNVARMKELTEEKRFALAAALLFRQLARQQRRHKPDSAGPEDSLQSQGADGHSTGKPSATVRRTRLHFTQYHDRFSTRRGDDTKVSELSGSRVSVRVTHLADGACF